MSKSFMKEIFHFISLEYQCNYFKLFLIVILNVTLNVTLDIDTSAIYDLSIIKTLENPRKIDEGRLAKSIFQLRPYTIRPNIDSVSVGYKG